MASVFEQAVAKKQAEDELAAANAQPSAKAASADSAAATQAINQQYQQSVDAQVAANNAAAATTTAEQAAINALAVKSQADQNITQQVQTAIAGQPAGSGQSAGGQPTSGVAGSGGGSAVLDKSQYGDVQAALQQAQTAYQDVVAASDAVAKTSDVYTQDIKNQKVQLGVQAEVQKRVNSEVLQYNFRDDNLHTANVLRTGEQQVAALNQQFSDLTDQITQAKQRVAETESHLSDPFSNVDWLSSPSKVRQHNEAVANLTRLTNERNNVLATIGAVQSVTTNQIKLGAASSAERKAQNAALYTLLDNTSVDTKLSGDMVAATATLYGVDKDKFANAINKAKAAGNLAALNIQTISTIAQGQQWAAIAEATKDKQQRVAMYKQGILGVALHSGKRINNVDALASLFAEGGQENLNAARQALGDDDYAAVFNYMIKLPNAPEATVGDVAGLAGRQTAPVTTAGHSAYSLLNDFATTQQKTIQDLATAQAGGADSWERLTPDAKAALLAKARTQVLNGASAGQLTDAAVFPNDAPGTSGVVIAPADLKQHLLDKGQPADLVDVVISTMPEELKTGVSNKADFQNLFSSWLSATARTQKIRNWASGTSYNAVGVPTSSLQANGTELFNALDAYLSTAMRLNAQRNYPQAEVGLQGLDTSKLSFSGTLKGGLLSQGGQWEYRAGQGAQGNLQLLRMLDFIGASTEASGN